jgi:peroxiredoxin
MDFAKKTCILMLLIIVAACGSVADDLYPSGSDKRPEVVPGSLGPLVGQTAPDFTLSDTLGNSVNLSTEVTGTGVKGVVLYFTMWCPTCDTHMSHMRDNIIPRFPDIRFFAVDYVSESVAYARAAQLDNGYADFRVLADIGDQVEKAYKATMGTTIVIDNTGIVRMNEDFKDGIRLNNALLSLP